MGVDKVAIPEMGSDKMMMIGRSGRRDKRRILEEGKGKILIMVIIIRFVGRIVEFVGGGVTNLCVEGVGRRGRRRGRDGHGECAEGLRGMEAQKNAAKNRLSIFVRAEGGKNEEKWSSKRISNCQRGEFKMGATAKI